MKIFRSFVPVLVTGLLLSAPVVAVAADQSGSDDMYDQNSSGGMNQNAPQSQDKTISPQKGNQGDSSSQDPGKGHSMQSPKDNSGSSGDSDEYDHGGTGGSGY